MKNPRGVRKEKWKTEGRRGKRERKREKSGRKLWRKE